MKAQIYHNGEMDPNNITAALVGTFVDVRGGLKKVGLQLRPSTVIMGVKGEVRGEAGDNRCCSI